ncbi:TetR/AcrR family transcriptional regulator [Sphingopyxis sp.]|uniref:TetR/AcrR family transcriptional regulator n=1 Tax=Sphingopyxis sp. TaxID=1908224 RepID=UPI002B495F0E|nr:TetR/AcrR family transcriptional regulator [Sphingopyxis sp.]HJS09784.1 TetR/AcrR family transcriptional regulator [Sphingopyxis sp.]
MGNKNAYGSRLSEAAARRRQAFIAAARDAFFTHGYGGTTMSGIAARVGGSKTTLWSYFSSKEQLFAAVVDDIIELYGAALSVPLPVDEPPQLVLERFGYALVATMASQPVLRLHRLVIGEAERFPALAQVLYEKGLRRGRARLKNYFMSLMALGRLRDGDPGRAAAQFVGLVQRDRFHLQLLGQSDDSGESSEEVADAVTVFLAFWSNEPLQHDGRAS